MRYTRYCTCMSWSTQNAMKKLESIRFKAEFRVPCWEHNQLWGWKFQGDRTQPANVPRLHHTTTSSNYSNNNNNNHEDPTWHLNAWNVHYLTAKRMKVHYSPPSKSRFQTTMRRRRPSVTAKRVKPPLSLPSNNRIQNKKVRRFLTTKNVWNVFFTAQTIRAWSGHKLVKSNSLADLPFHAVCPQLHSPLLDSAVHYTLLPLCPALLCATLLSSPLLRSTLLFRSLYIHIYIGSFSPKLGPLTISVSYFIFYLLVHLQLFDGIRFTTPMSSEELPAGCFPSTLIMCSFKGIACVVKNIQGTVYVLLKGYPVTKLYKHTQSFGSWYLPLSFI